MQAPMSYKVSCLTRATKPERDTIYLAFYLDLSTIQTALSKCPPRQQMWGISGQEILGVSLAINGSAYEPTLGILSSWQVTDEYAD